MSSPSTEPRVIAQRYQLRAMLGSGSMGTVWSAYDEHLQRSVAIKEIRLPSGYPETVASQLRERTLREARAIAMLTHPNVIVLHDVAHEDGDPFVVMELLAGRSVADLLATHGALGTAQAAAVADAVAAALESAHNSGITHRDVKPGNVLLGDGGQIKLTDFGIARNVSEDTMTGTGVMLGSPAYIAPEVAAGSATSPAADLWGLGATLFTAVEGSPPYDVDGDPLETVGRVVHGDVPEPTPGPLAEVISGLMVKDPDERTALSDVRARVFPLLDTPAHTLFTPGLLGTADAGDTVEHPATVPAADAEPTLDTTNGATDPDVSEEDALSDNTGPPGDATGGSGELAAEPGPLPFTPAVQSPESSAALGDTDRRNRARASALVVVSIVLFLTATIGGFLTARFVGGQPLLPPREEQSPTVDNSTEPTFDLVPRDGDAANLEGVTGGQFSINVPRDWKKFLSATEPTRLPRSKLVQFVSPDGSRTLTVQRYADYFPVYGTEDYLRVLRDRWDSDDFVLADRSGPRSGGGAVTLTYRTVQHAGQESSSPHQTAGDTANHTTIARLLRRDNSLWVVGVTIPTTQEQSARTKLFDRIVPTFETTG